MTIVRLILWLVTIFWLHPQWQFFGIRTSASAIASVPCTSMTYSVFGWKVMEGREHKWKENTKNKLSTSLPLTEGRKSGRLFPFLFIPSPHLQTNTALEGRSVAFSLKSTCQYVYMIFGPTFCVLFRKCDHCAIFKVRVTLIRKYDTYFSWLFWITSQVNVRG